MSISSHWDDLHHSIIRTVCRQWTWTELASHEQQVVSPMLVTGSHPIALIIKTHAMAVNDGHLHFNYPPFILPEASMRPDMIVFVTNFAENAMPLSQAHARYSAVCDYYSIAPSAGSARRMVQQHRASRAV
ncbi:MAG: hypothetical protein ACPG7F_17050 [Aggregatilineales bacterium]